MPAVLASLENLPVLNAAAERVTHGVQTRREGDLWIAHNNLIEIAVNTSTGVTARLLDKVSGDDYCHQNVM